MTRLLPLAAVAGALLTGAPAGAQAPQMTPPQMVAAQQGAMTRIAALDGVWRGMGAMTDVAGQPLEAMTMSVRVGPFLDGAVKVIETRGQRADGSLRFHAFNTVGFDAQKGEYSMNARAGGRSGNFSFHPTADGYVWQIGSGEAGLRYTGVVKGGVWTEVGEAIAPGRAPVRMSEMTLRRVGDTDWPEAGAVPTR